jgi:4-hydroxy-3-methylbut-2-enyl diphosphate reductase
VFSQTTKEPEVFAKIIDEIKSRMGHNFANTDVPLKVNNTICGQVANRKKELADFSTRHDVIVFVSGVKSSNGKMLFDACRQANPKSYFVSSPEELNPEWFIGAESVGIGGATSTPQWLMERVAKRIDALDMSKK